MVLPTPWILKLKSNIDIPFSDFQDNFFGQQNAKKKKNVNSMVKIKVKGFKTWEDKCIKKLRWHKNV